MIRISLFAIILFFSCTAQSDYINKTVSPGNDELFQIEARLIQLELAGDKFKLTVVLENETGINSFSIADTVYLFPNFLRKEGSDIQIDDSINQKMNSLKDLEMNTSIKASVKLRGTGKQIHGLIMDWVKK